MTLMEGRSWRSTWIARQMPANVR